MAGARRGGEAARELVRVAHGSMARQEVETLTLMAAAVAPGPLAGTVPALALATAHMLRAIDLYRQSGMTDHELAAHLRRWAANPVPRPG